jgi:murein DD-endopeptidase MepM/ murein hydrolase activator NlpD
MPAFDKRQRGATVVSNNTSRVPLLPQLPLSMPQKWVAAGIVALTCIAAGVILGNSGSTDNAAQSGINSGSILPAHVTQPSYTAESGLAETITAAVASAEIATQDEPPPPEPHPWKEQIVQNGDNLSLIFKRAGFGTADVYRVVSESADGKSLARIYPGQSISFKTDDARKLQAVRHVRSPLETVTYERTGKRFQSQLVTREPEPRIAQASAVITSSLFLAGQDAGLSQNMIMELAGIFGGVIDFVQDPRKGDTINLVYEELYLDGEKYKDGHIIAASFTNQGKTYNAYRYTDSSGLAAYYNEDGVSMRKAFLLAPVDFTRISSNFNLRRLHPIYKTTRPHRGTDYAAPTGTPVYAAGDGRVIKAGYSRANGNYVFIQHGDRYVTHYLHLNKRNVKQGQRVAQSQVIGTVGSTGAATGPHLHYEFLVNGVHRDPRTIHKEFPKAKSLDASELALFKQNINEAALQLASLQTNKRLAMHQAVDHNPSRN